MKFSTTQWIAWLGATITACVTLTAFAYTNFETKEDAKDKKADIMKGIEEIKGDLKSLNNYLLDQKKEVNKEKGN